MGLFLGGVRRKAALNPNAPAQYYLARGMNYFVMEAFDRAIEVLRISTIKFPTFIPCYLFLAGSLALPGRIAEAAKVKDDIYRLNSGFTLTLRSAASDVGWKYPADADRIERGLRLAGLV